MHPPRPINTRSLAAVLVLALIAFAHADVHLEGALFVGEACDAHSVAVADFDTDGNPDLVMPLSCTRMLRVFFSDDSGRFPRSTTITTSGFAPWDVATDDLNGDGHADIVAAVRGGSQQLVAVHLGNGTGTFRAPGSYLTGGLEPRKLLVARVDSDAIPDVVVLNRDSSNMSVFLGVGDGALLPPRIYALGLQPEDLTAGDFDRDGALDLAIVGSSHSRVRILLGDGTGGFPRGSWLETSARAYSITSADFGHDGSLDLAVGNFMGTGFTVYRGDGTGGFSLGASIPVAPTLHSIVSADFDEDGNPDLAAVTGANAQARVYRGDGTGGFTPTQVVQVGANHRRLIVADTNLDGAADIITPDHVSGGAAILLGHGDATFAAPTILGNVGEPHDVVVTDFDGDGNQDIASTDREGRVNIFLNDGARGFVRSSYDAGNQPHDIVTGDHNGDGVPDLIISNRYDHLISLLIGAGDGSFPTRREFPTSPGPTHLATGDFNGDGNLDVAVACTLRHNFNVLYGNGNTGYGPLVHTRTINHPRTVSAGDFDGDGNLDVVVGQSYWVEIFRGLGDGFFERGYRESTEYSIVATNTGDWNGDGHLDLADAGDDNYVHVRLGRGDWTFAPPQAFLLHCVDSSTRLESGDLDGDGHPDLVASNASDNTHAVLHGQGDGRFNVDYIVNAGPRGFDIADVDGNGLLELVSTSARRNRVVIFWNRTALAECFAGSVNTGAGAPVDVLFANGQTGSGSSRRVVVDASTPLRLFMNAPPSQAPAPFAAYVFRNAPSEGTGRILPFQLGAFCRPHFLTDTMPADLNLVWNNIGNRRVLGTPHRPSTPAPSELAFLPQGVGRPGEFFVQGILLDSSAPNGRAAVTNGVTIVSQ